MVFACCADFNQVAEVIADVLAGAETIYTASNRAREQAVARPETVEWPAQTETAASADAQSDDKADSAEFSRSRQYGEDDAVQMYPVDIEETGEGYSLFMDVPGLQKSDIKVGQEICSFLTPRTCPRSRFMTNLVNARATEESKKNKSRLVAPNSLMRSEAVFFPSSWHLSPAWLGLLWPYLYLPVICAT